MKMYHVSFKMTIRDSCEVPKTPEELLQQDQEDGYQLGYYISNVKTKLIEECKDD
jgi:hypothetical protein